MSGSHCVLCLHCSNWKMELTPHLLTSQCHVLVSEYSVLLSGMLTYSQVSKMESPHCARPQSSVRTLQWLQSDTRARVALLPRALNL